MIRELGTIGFHIKFNESASAGLKFLEIFSSSAATTSLFSASTSSAQTVSLSLNSASCYINSAYSSVTYSNEWQQMVFTFFPTLVTNASNNFLIRFGNTTKGDFQIQNVFMIKDNLNPLEVGYIYNEFSSNTTAITAGDTSSVSITVSDKNENNHISASSKSIYQPLLPNQIRYKFDVAVATDTAVPTGTLTGDNRFFDGGYEISAGQRILCLADNKVYVVNTNSTLSEDPTTNGDYVKVFFGMEYANEGFVKVSGSFINTELVEKIVSSISNI